MKLSILVTSLLAGSSMAATIYYDASYTWKGKTLSKKSTGTIADNQVKTLIAKMSNWSKDKFKAVAHGSNVEVTNQHPYNTAHAAENGLLAMKTVVHQHIK